MSKLKDRSYNVIAVVLIAAAALILKAAQIQLFDTKYREQAKKATLGKETLFPSRGLIYDRNGKLLVTNRTLYDLEVTYRNVPSDIDTALFCDLLKIEKADFVKRLNKDWSSPRYHKSVPFMFMSKIDPETFAVFYEHLHKFPGFIPVVRNIRDYPHENAAQLLGYLGEVDQETIESGAGKYNLGDYLGVSGVERTFDDELRGTRGVSYVMKDNLGRKVGLFDDGSLDSLAVSGKDLVCSIDLILQSYGEQLMKGKKGAVVAIEPSTGEILAMISSPNYDPNEITLDKNRGMMFDSLLSDTIGKPFLDRTIMGSYPPGSIFKPIFSAIAIQDSILDPNRTIYCDGTYELNSSGDAVQKCHHHPTPYNVSIALQHSCNTYYYQIMREYLNRYGYENPGRALDTLVKRLHKFGLGEKLHVDSPIEEKGYLPDSKFYDRLYRKESNGWKSTYVLSLGIGQGEIQVTTTQMANLAAIMANRGHYITPHVVKEYVDKHRAIDPIYRTRKYVGVDKEVFEPLVEGMEKAMTRGTAEVGYVPGLDICGKTGTSQNPFGKDHSVFFGFAPRENPQIAIAVYVENAGWGGVVATPIASLMMEQYLTNEIRPRRKYLEDKIKKLDLIERDRTLAVKSNVTR